jgi:hypothetical protein
MVQDRTKPLAELLADGPLGELASQARRRRALTERVRAELPAELATHLVSAATNDSGELVLNMASAAWAARARYALQTLGDQLIRIKVSPAGGRPGVHKNRDA